MAITLTADDARHSLTAHVAAKGEEIHAKYGPEIGYAELVRLLEDRAFVRYPCEIAFDATQLHTGEFAHAAAKGSRPEEGYTLFIHPLLMTDLEKVPAAALYHLVVVNYGDFASAEDAETFGAAALGMDRESYYQTLCGLADELSESQGD